jgi:hypothetical protein
MSNSNLARSLIAFAFLSLTSATMPALAAGGGSDESASNKTIEFSGLVLPVQRDGKLINYLFVSAMVTLSPKYDQWEVRETAHVYRDLILKAAHKSPVGRTDKPMRLDEAAFDALVRTVFDEQLGPDSVASIKIIAVDSQKVFLNG